MAMGTGVKLKPAIANSLLAQPNVLYSSHFLVKDYGLTVDSLRWVDGLSSLKSLDLSGWNNFNSTIPLWLSNVTSLKQLQLDHNSFNVSIPDNFEKFTSLAVHDLSSNFFGIQLPNSFCKLTSLVHMDLNGNNFQGTIPYCFKNLTSLAILNLEANYLEGPIPDSITQMCSLQVLDLSLNQFNSPLPTPIRDPSVCLLNSLKELQLEMYRNPEVLHLSFNSLSGTIPSELGSLSHLRELYISNNKFYRIGQLGQLVELVKLEISNNSLSCVVSEVHFEQLSKLKNLLVSSNSFLFKASPLWIPPFQLQMIELESTDVGPQFPPWLQTQKGVKRLIMSNASISDAIPGWFENMYSRIDDLDLSHNSISGRLPKFEEYNDSFRVIKLKSNKFKGTVTYAPLGAYLVDLSENSLEGQLPLFDSYLNLSQSHLSLFDNHFTGEISPSLCEIQSLIIIDLSSNQLSGKIPSCLANLQNLHVLDLSNNSFHGKIPNSLGFIEGIRALHLQQNNLHGKLPSSFQNLKNLRILDIGNNGFNDITHPWIGNLWDLMFLSLKILILSKNNLSGSIPHCFNNFITLISEDPQMSCYMKFMLDRTVVRHLSMLYFERRMLESMKGRELKYSRSLQYLKRIELSENSISGQIPEEIMELIGLQNLNLSGNCLQGRIPDKIGNLKQLESLDLSRYKLSSPIPPSLSTLNSLSRLNLSFNELSGQIPTGNQLQTLNDPSIYAGNGGLCGVPLLRTCPDEKSSNGDKYMLENNGEMELELSWFYAGLGPGFGFGFMIVRCILVFKKPWRAALFQFLESFLTDKGSKWTEGYV
ncbi:receptor-like protein EIX2 [Coffea eugenioides]|uniref:receptor-like protein EIX2 n=1 Tax=Coffea eugenioides TaxID=49369 RepID=UPI000F6113C4|nr:receptor-like protein EIX2 [Coffea eugenioides]